MEAIREITEEERQQLGLFVGRRLRIIGKPIEVRCGNNRIVRRKDGGVTVSIGYYSENQILGRKRLSQKIFDNILAQSIFARPFEGDI